MPRIQHPDVEEILEVPESAVAVHEKSGWSRVNLADLPKSELLAEAERSGAPISKTATKAEIVEAIESTKPQEA